MHEGKAPYDGWDMMSGGNGYTVSHIAAASKWFWNWIPNSSIVLMQPEGTTVECPTCLNAGTFKLTAFDDKDVSPSSSKKMAIHIPIVPIETIYDENIMFSYWLSYRTGNDGKAAKGVSVHFSWFNLGGPFGASYGSHNYDAFGDTETTSDSFVEEGTCYHVAPSGYMKDRNMVAVWAVQPVVCVNSIDVGTSATITVSFLDPENAPASQVNVQETSLDCSTSGASTSFLELNANDFNMIHVRNTGADGVVIVEMCSDTAPSDLSSTAFLHDE